MANPKPPALHLIRQDSATSDVGARIYALIEKLYPICRSITGDGVRETLAIINEQVPLEIHEVPTGTQVFDWRVPKEWNVRDAYVRNAKGEKVIDFQESNLHLVSYSCPIREKMPLSVLRRHLHTYPELPDRIPYKTDFSDDGWGFCLAHDQLLRLEEGEYEVVIDTTLEDGSLTYGECFLPGETEAEIHFFTLVCHPSLCNDNLSGVAVQAELARWLGARPRRYSYRFVFAPTTIGSITWLSRNEALLPRIRAGLVLAMLGDRGKLTYKLSRRGDAEIDRAALCSLRGSGRDFETMPFGPFGTDERQYCSPGLNLPMGRLTRSPDGTYPEYHSSKDNLDFVDPDCLADSFRACVEIVDLLEANRRYVGTVQKGEPQLSRRNIVQRFGAGGSADDEGPARLWVLNLSDGDHSLLDIAERSGLGFPIIERAAATLRDAGLLIEAADARPAGG